MRGVGSDPESLGVTRSLRHIVRGPCPGEWEGGSSAPAPRYCALNHDSARVCAFQLRVEPCSFAGLARADTELVLDSDSEGLSVLASQAPRAGPRTTVLMRRSNPKKH